MEKTFKIKMTNEPKDEHLKMSLIYHVPMERFADLLQYLEKVAPRKIKTTTQED